MRTIIFIFLLAFIFKSCTVSYKFNGASINYDETPTIDIKDFQNQALFVYPQLTQIFNEHVKDVFIQNTKLKLTSINPALELEGEIVRYETTPLAAKEDGKAGQTRLTMDVRMRFKNNKNPSQDKEETISAYYDFDSNEMLTDVQDRAVNKMTKEIVDQMFNATMSNW